MEESSRLRTAHIRAIRTREWVRDSRAGVRTVSKYTFLVFIFFFFCFRPAGLAQSYRSRVLSSLALPSNMDSACGSAWPVVPGALSLVPIPIRSAAAEFHACWITGLTGIGGYTMGVSTSKGLNHLHDKVRT